MLALPKLGLAPGLGWQTKGIFQFSQNVFLRKQNQGEGRGSKPARQTASLPCVERLSEVINLLKHTHTRTLTHADRL